MSHTHTPRAQTTGTDADRHGQTHAQGHRGLAERAGTGGRAGAAPQGPPRK